MGHFSYMFFLYSSILLQITITTSLPPSSLALTAGSSSKPTVGTQEMTPQDPPMTPHCRKRWRKNIMKFGRQLWMGTFSKLNSCSRRNQTYAPLLATFLLLTFVLYAHFLQCFFFFLHVTKTITLYCTCPRL